MYVKPRRETNDKTNTMYQMVQAKAVDDTSKAPEVPISKVVPEDVYPTEEAPVCV